MSVDVTQVLLGALSRVRRAATRKQVALALESPVDLPHTTGKAPQLARVLHTLLSHAIQVSSMGGVVRVITGVTSRPADSLGDSVAIVVTDSGAAMRREGFDRLLSAFRPSQILQMQGRHGGRTLSLTCRLGGLAGGRVWVKSRAGHGSIFAAVLPVSRRGQRRAAE